MKSFCCIDIDVRGKELHKTCEMKVQAIQQLADELAEKHDASLFDVGRRLCNLGQQMVKHGQARGQTNMVEQAPSWSGSLQLLATWTLQNNDSLHSITTPLSGLSGGEIEILMTLCAIHLSGAETVILDEPGHSLHPPLQAQMRRWIETQGPRDQVCVVVTHSTEFISPQSLSCLYHMAFVGRGFTPFRLRLQGQASGSSDAIPATEDEAQSVLVQEAAGPSCTPQSSQTSPRQVIFTQEIITMLMRPDMHKMFFATGLYFVEGETDKRVLSAVRHCMMEEANEIMKTNKSVRHLLRAKEVLEMDRWDILALGGCSEAVKAYKAATELKIPCAIVLDLDAITVKNGKRVGPFNSANWKKSKLYKQLWKEQQSLPEAETLLNDVEEVLKEDIQGEALLMKAREAFKKHGFWIWKGDLETAICDNPEARTKFERMKTFLEAIDGKLPFSSSPDDRQPMQAKEVLNNFDEKVMGPLHCLMSELDAELSSTRDKIIESPTESVTQHFEDLINRIKQMKQIMTQHDKFVEKGTKGKRAQDAPKLFDDNQVKRTKKKTTTTTGDESASIPSAELSLKQQTSHDTASGIMEVKMSSSSEASRSSPVMTETQQSIFWDYAKRKLHNEGGWGRIPWETLLEVVKVCLQTEPSPLADFCRFMKRRQCKEQKRKKELPQDLLSRILPSDEEDDDD